MILLIGILILILCFLVIALVRNKADVKARKISSELILTRTYQPPSKIDSTTLNFQIYVLLAAWLVKKNAVFSADKNHFIFEQISAKFQVAESVIQSEYELAKQTSIHIRSVSNWVVQSMRDSTKRVELMEFLIELIFTDGDLIDREFTALIRLGELIGVKQSFIEQKVIYFRKIYLGNHFSEKCLSEITSSKTRRKLALALLNLTEDATQADIKSSYRSLIKEFHPDKNSGLSESEIQEKTNRFLEIQDAYEELSGD